jgi:hypothetical protein
MNSKPSTMNRSVRKASPRRLEEPGATVRKIFIVENHLLMRQTLVRIVRREKGLTVCGEASDTVQASEAIGRGA